MHIRLVSVTLNTEYVYSFHLMYVCDMYQYDDRLIVMILILDVAM